MDPFTIVMIVLLAVLVFFMFRSSRKRKQQAEDLRTKLVPGAPVMTNQGIFGTIIEIDEEGDEILIESTPGTRLRVHKQTVGRVIEPPAPEVDPTPGDDLIDQDEPASPSEQPGDDNNK